MSVSEAEIRAAVIAFEALAEPGPAGPHGDPGPQGEKGEAGARGPEGPQGTTGPKGDRGPTGADGALGQVGPRGEQGPQGADGAAGRDGRDGTDGRDGIDGAPGTPGERGPRGFAGQAGTQGERGEKGERGPAGQATSTGAYTGIQVMSNQEVISSYALSMDFGSGIDVEMDRNVARVSVSPTAGSDANYVHDQVSASALWDITHGLGKYPAVTVIDSAGDVCVGDIHYVSTNRVTVAFGAAFSGVATLN